MTPPVSADQQTERVDACHRCGHPANRHMWFDPHPCGVGAQCGCRSFVCCEHVTDDHDEWGCTVDVSTDSRAYERCHGGLLRGLLPEAEQTERVALAIWNATMRDEMTADDWCKALAPEDREFYREQARAAIAAVGAGQAEEAVALCPKCGGQGVVSRPSWVPADQPTWGSHTTGPYRCNLCQGRMVIPLRAALDGDTTTGGTA